RYSLSFSLDRLFPTWMSSVTRRTHQPWAGIVVVSVIGAVLLPLITFYYQAAYEPLIFLLFFLPMVTVSLTCLSLVRLGLQKHRPMYTVVGVVSLLVTEPLDGAASPRFAQVATFARLPLQRDFKNARSVFLGLPWDDATSYRSGAREGPSAIRHASRLVRPYNMFADVYPFRVLDTVDAGDVDPVPGYTEDTFARIESALKPMFAADIVPFMAGGDHSVTLPVLRARKAAGKEAASLLHFDAHFDTWEAYWGSKRYTHGTWVKRAYEEGLIARSQVFQVGIRSSLYSHEDVRNNAAIVDRTYTSEDVDSQGYKVIMDRILEAIKDRPLYVSVDIDVLDPAYAPGTG